MSALYANDLPGVHAASVYAAGISPPERPVLTGALSVDVAVVGAGFTGLWAAKTLAEAGRDVTVLDAHRVGFGASGRNGGQVHSGYNLGQSVLAAKLGETQARALWDLSEAAKAQLKAVAAQHPETAFRPGVALGEYDGFGVADLRLESEYLARTHGFEVSVMDRPAFSDLVRTSRYAGGALDHSGGHLNPLAYALALARSAEAAGASIHERSEVTQITPGPRLRLDTPRGHVEAGHVIVAGNGYLPPILPAVSARVMPINSFIAATAPLPERWRDVLAEDIAVADSKFVVNYYRFDENRRFLFGGRESYGLGFPRDIRSALITRMEGLFPQLRGVGIDYVWGGTLGITRTRLPHVARLGPNILSGAGFSGQGVALSGMAGRVMAEAVLGQEAGVSSFEALRVPPFPGGPALRTPLLTLAMMWFALRDRIGF